MGAVRGFVSGGVALSAFYLVLTSNQKGLDQAAGMPGKVLHWLIDPNVPLIPDRTTKPPAAKPNFPNGNPDGALPHINPDGSIPMPGSGPGGIAS